ncbi:hypothetical protein [Promicromonospora sp. MEB111]|nr:hypothetical protein [Promicromonospora sp. MEB111]
MRTVVVTGSASGIGGHPAAPTHLCGQVVFIDGGSDAVIRGDSTW